MKNIAEQLRECHEAIRTIALTAHLWSEKLESLAAQVGANEIIVKCSCGRKYTLEEWLNLHKVGVQTVQDGEQPDQFELRDCVCKSTLMIPMDKEGNYYGNE